MNLRFPLILFMILLLAGVSCEYVNQDQHYVEPESGPEPVLISVMNLQEDSVYVVRDSLLVAYEVYLDTGELYYIEGSIGNLVYYSHWPSYDPDTVDLWPVVSDSFYLANAFSYEADTYSLYMDFYYATNSNSLADILGIEYEMHTREYRILFTDDVK